MAFRNCNQEKYKKSVPPIGPAAGKEAWGSTMFSQLNIITYPRVNWKLMYEYFFK